MRNLLVKLEKDRHFSLRPSFNMIKLLNTYLPEIHLSRFRLLGDNLWVNRELRGINLLCNFLLSETRILSSHLALLLFRAIGKVQ